MKTKAHAGSGLAAGLAATGVMMALRMFDQKYAPKTVPHAKEDPGEFVVRNVESLTGALPETAEKTGALALHLTYGTGFGLLYSLWRKISPRSSPLLDGAVLGTAVYAAGYLGWLPALGLTRPLWRQRFPSIAGELARHVVYGVAAVTAYDAMEDIL
jgi:hypothetical protein